MTLLDVHHGLLTASAVVQAFSGIVVRFWLAWHMLFGSGLQWRGFRRPQLHGKPVMAELAYSDPRKVRLQTYGSSWDEIRDLIKACCFITGRAFEEVGTPERISQNQYWPGDCFEWGFFLFRPYKKGTVHFEFQNPEVWAALNARYARIKGQVLPEKLRTKRKSRRAS
jgi:hypothetical protein